MAVFIRFTVQKSSGKTTFFFESDWPITEARRKCCFYLYRKYSAPSYAKHVGVKVGDLLVAQLEDALNIVETLIQKNSMDVVVIYSVVILISKDGISVSNGECTCELASPHDQSNKMYLLVYQPNS